MESYDICYMYIGVETLPISEQRILDKVSGTTYKVSNHINDITSLYSQYDVNRHLKCLFGRFALFGMHKLALAISYKMSH